MRVMKTNLLADVVIIRANDKSHHTHKYTAQRSYLVMGACRTTLTIPDMLFCDYN